MAFCAHSTSAAAVAVTPELDSYTPQELSFRLGKVWLCKDGIIILVGVLPVFIFHF